MQRGTSRGVRVVACDLRRSRRLSAARRGMDKAGYNRCGFASRPSGREREGTGQPPFHFWALNESYESARERIGRLKNECMAARAGAITSNCETSDVRR
jgi:hypothetical protein